MQAIRMRPNDPSFGEAEGLRQCALAISGATIPMWR